MGIPFSASIEEFAHGFKDTPGYNDIIEVDNISLCSSDSKEDCQPIDPPKGQIPCQLKSQYCSQLPYTVTQLSH